MHLRHSASEPALTVMKSQSGGMSDHSQHLLTLAETAAAQGDHEVAYCLFAKGCPTVAASELPQITTKVHALSAGRLKMLSEMCKIPAIAAAAAPVPAPHKVQDCQTAGRHLQMDDIHRAKHHSSKRWQQLQSRFQPQHHCSCSCSSSSSSSSSSSCSSSSSSSCSSSSSSSSSSSAVLPQLPSHNTIQPQQSQFNSRRCTATSPSHTCLPSSPSSSHTSNGNGTTTTSSSSSNSCCCAPRRRVFCVSDLHVDRAGGANLSWVKSISSTIFKNDMLIIAGGKPQAKPWIQCLC